MDIENTYLPRNTPFLLNPLASDSTSWFSWESFDIGEPMSLNNISGNPTTNTTIFSSDKVSCKFAVAFFGTTTYWIEVGDYSTFDIDQNNLKYQSIANMTIYVNRTANITESINGFKFLQMM